MVIFVKTVVFYIDEETPDSRKNNSKPATTATSTDLAGPAG